MAARSLILIRHGFPLKSVGKPSKDWELSKKGVEQSERLVRHLMQFNVDNPVFSSDEIKAVQTAEILGKGLSKSVDKSKLLREIDRRSTSGLSSDEFIKLNLEMFKTPYQPVVGNESTDRAKHRFIAGVEQLIATNQEVWQGDLLIVAHATVITLFLSEFNEINLIDFWAKFNCTDYVRVTYPDFKIVDRFKNT